MAPSNAVSSGTPSQAINTNTYYTCKNGYSGAPYVNCSGHNSTVGSWSTTYFGTSCSRMRNECPNTYSYSYAYAPIYAPINFRTVIANYCTTAPPSVFQATFPSPYVQPLNGVLTYTCNLGYSGVPNVMCTQFNATAGVWGSVASNCSCTL